MQKVYMVCHEGYLRIFFTYKEACTYTLSLDTDEEFTVHVTTLKCLGEFLDKSYREYL